VLFFDFMAADYPLFVSSNFFLTIKRKHHGMNAFLDWEKCFEIIFSEAGEILYN